MKEALQAVAKKQAQAIAETPSPGQMQGSVAANTMQLETGTAALRADLAELAAWPALTYSMDQQETLASPRAPDSAAEELALTSTVTAASEQRLRQAEASIMELERCLEAPQAWKERAAVEAALNSVLSLIHI